MDITIIGTGNMGRAIATRALAGGHPVTLLVLALWYAAVDDVLGRYRDQLEGKVLVDITNPIDVEAFEPLTLQARSAAQEIAAKAHGARVVKAFNTTFAGTLVEGQVAGQPPDVFVASDDEDAKRTVSHSSKTEVCAPSTPVRSRALASSKPSATSTWRCSSRSAPASPAQ